MTDVHDGDLLDDLVARVNLRARIAFRGQLCERWAIGGGAQGRLGFHIVLSGRSWLRVTDQQMPVELGAGGLYLYRPDERHLLSDTVLTAQESPPARIVALAERFDGARVGLLCGYFEGGPADTPVVDAVPAYLLWRRHEDFPEPLARLMGALVACAHDDTRGGGQVLERLCELLLRMILREPQVLRHDRLGFLRAQRDPVLRRVFDAIHARPGRPWTLTTLARSAGISRSALAARFKDQAGIPAMHYLRRYRVQLGERRMHEDGWSVKQAARALGYNSVSAFRRAARRS